MRIIFNYKKVMSHSLILGILLNNTLAFSYAQDLPEYTRYETVKGDYLTINSIATQDIVDLELEGNTLVNINTKKKYKYVAHSNNDGSYNKTESINEVKANIHNDIQSWNYVESGTIKPGMLKPNTEYTVIFEKNVGVKKVLLQTHDATEVFTNTQPVVDNRAVLRTTSNVSNIQPISVYCIVDTKANSSIHVKNVSVIEGDHTNKDIDYFDGIKSAGENEFDNKIIVSSNNKNLFNTSTLYAENYRGESNEATFEVDGDSLKISKLTEGGNFIGTRIKVTKGKMYTIGFVGGLDNSGTSYSAYVYYDKPWGDLILRFSNSSTTEMETRSFIADTNEIYVGLYMGSSVRANEVLEFKNVFVSEGENVDYIASQRNNKEFILNQPLRGLPNGAKDKIIKKNGAWYIERNTDVIDLSTKDFTGELIGSQFQNDETIAFRIDTPKRKTSRSYNSNNSVLSGMFLEKEYSSIIKSNSLEGLFADDTYKSVYCRLKKERLSGYNLTFDGIKKYFIDNPTKLVYELENPVYEPINISSTLILHEDTTHIFNDSSIPINIKVVVDRVINIANNCLELAISNPTAYNISQARYWINLIDEHIIKDQLQDRVNNI